MTERDLHEIRVLTELFGPHEKDVLPLLEHIKKLESTLAFERASSDSRIAYLEQKVEEERLRRMALEEAMKEPPVNCSICHQPTEDYCRTLVCRDCHKTESLEDCLANVQVNAVRGKYDLPPLDG